MLALLSLIKKVPINDFVYHVVTNILSTCVKSQKAGHSTFSMSGMYLILNILFQRIL